MVIEREAADHAERLILIGYAKLVKLGFTFENLVLCRFKKHVDATKNEHRHDNVFVLAFLEGMDENIVSDVPKEREKFTILRLVHRLSVVQKNITLV